MADFKEILVDGQVYKVKDETARENAGSGDGTVTGVKVGSTTYEPTDGVVDMSTPFAGKVDKVTGYGLSKNDYTDADKTAVGTIPSKANDADVVKSISVNGGTAQTPQNGNVNIQVQGAAGITPHIGSNGHWWLGDENDSENDTGVNAQGPAGTSYTSADLTIGNALNGQGDVLGMGGAMMIKSNVDSLYTSLNRLFTKLANMAFWDAEDQADAEPTPLDWSLPKVTVTITNSIGSGAVIKHNGSVVNGSVQVDQGDSLTLTVEAADNNIMYGVAATVDGVAATLTESSGVYTLAVDHVDAAMTVVFNGVAYAPLHKGVFVDVSSNRYYIQGGSPSSQKRACLLMPRSLTTSPCTWGTTSPDGYNATQEMLDYTTIPIPSGATQVSFQCDADYYYGLTLVNSSGAAQNTVEWTIGSTKKTLNMADYPNATHIAINFKIGSAGSTAFSNETYDSMGIDFQII